MRCNDAVTGQLCSTVIDQTVSTDVSLFYITILSVKVTAPQHLLAPSAQFEHEFQSPLH